MGKKNIKYITVKLDVNKRWKRKIYDDIKHSEPFEFYLNNLDPEWRYEMTVRLVNSTLL